MNDEVSDMLKSDLIRVMKKIINENSWTQTEAADKFGIHRTRLSKILSGKVDYISEIKLIKCIISSGKCAELHIRDGDCKSVEVIIDADE